MSKYITTKEHPELKEGIEIGLTGANIQKNEMFRSIEGHWKASDYIIKNCLEKGYIKEVEKLEFTLSDLIDLVKFTDKYPQIRIKSNEGIVDDWIEGKARLKNKAK